MKKCSQCGIEFEANNKKRIFCSNKCRQKVYRQSVEEIIQSSKKPKNQSFISAENYEVQILKEIIAIEREEIPNERNTPLGKAVWSKEKKERIEALKLKIK